MGGSCPNKSRALWVGLIGLVVGGGIGYFAAQRASGAPGVTTEPPAMPDVVAMGERLVKLGSCHDCHTPMNEKGERAPREQWLTGTPVGWRGPWGTTYASNLRLLIAGLPDAESWVTYMRSKPAELRRPPMVWEAMDTMTDAELSAIYAYIKSLGEGGEAMPTYLPPGEAPKGPWMSLDPSMNK